METQSNFGGGKRIRTADPLHAMQVLYQLSYTPERDNAFYRFKKQNARGTRKKLTVFHLNNFQVMNTGRSRQCYAITFSRF